MILKIIYYSLIVITNIYGLYFIITAIPVFIKKEKNIKHPDKLHYFEILIPARNEEQVIGNLINSLKKLDYDKTKYEITVILNNTQDKTKDISLSQGANIIECQNKITCKGDALKETFGIFKDRQDIDAYIIIDADNIVDASFLTHMNNSLNKGYQVAQGFRDIKNLNTNWISSSYALYYYIQNLFFNQSRILNNSSSSINGTGFMIKKDLIDSEGFNTKTLTEDIEFAGLCSLNNIKIDYVSEAITYDEQPTNFKVSWNQRKRWSKGALECFKIYSSKLLTNIKNNKSSLDMFLLYSSPIIQVLTVITFILSLIINFQNKTLLTTQNMILMILLTIIAYLAQISICLYVIILNKKSIKKYLSGILLFPIFLLTWIPINIIILIKKNIKWQSIPHTHTVSIDEIN